MHQIGELTIFYFPRREKGFYDLLIQFI
jgi:hypothetical protein